MKYSAMAYFALVFFLALSACTSPKADPVAILEIVDTEYRVSTQILLDECKKNNIPSDEMQMWEQHWVVFSSLDKINKLKIALENDYPSLNLKLYDAPFYNFNRQKMTGEKPASEWKNIIMTANLVEDSTLQNEYMEYHRTQFEKWPEVSRGFIKADFQQLLVFRHGRQLMLVISIPKGKTLDELNPKTTENNPRVDEWNKIMGKYQEGIEDAPKGTTWVVFSDLH